MKKLIVTACAAALSISAHAERYTYEYTATVTELNEFVFVGYQINPLQQAVLPGGTVALGDTFSGRFSFDTAWAPAYEYQYDYWHSASYSGDVSVSATFSQGLRFTTRQIGAVNISDIASGSTGPDSLAFSNTVFSDFSEGVDIQFGSQNTDTLTSIALRDAPAFISAATGVATYHYTTYGPYVSIKAKGELTSLRLVSAVPEPTTYAMFAAGLGLLAWRRKRA
ncbi:PEP-CTERM sorting domain-containing protein [Pseudoduganella armeniaca]|nr:PEP-CTERM sorting domain-containing protein [Pseudoduganella armeniaca]